MRYFIVNVKAAIKVNLDVLFVTWINGHCSLTLNRDFLALVEGGDYASPVVEGVRVATEQPFGLGTCAC